MAQSILVMTFLVGTTLAAYAGTGGGGGTGTVIALPEPASMALLAGGVALALGIRNRRK